MELNIVNLQKRFSISEKKIKKKIKQVFLLQNKTNVVLSIVFVDNKIIKKLNKEYLHKNYPTDVLAFNLKNKKSSKSILDGEIIISLDAAEKNARLFKTSFNYETLLYLIHGILHLSGFNDRTKIQKKIMRKKEKYLIKKVYKDAV
jgi:probable rRNA maturation factor